MSSQRKKVNSSNKRAKKTKDKRQINEENIETEDGMLSITKEDVSVTEMSDVDDKPNMEISTSTSSTTSLKPDQSLLEELVNHPAIKDLSIKPIFEVVDKAVHRYKIINVLDENMPAIVLPKSDPENNMSRLAFSCFTNRLGDIPSYDWLLKPCPGIAAIKPEENLELQLLLVTDKNGIISVSTDIGHQPLIGKTDDYGTSYEMKTVKIKLDPDNIIIDRFTLGIIDRCDVQFIKSISNALRIDHIIMVDPVEQTKKKRNAESEAIVGEALDKLAFRIQAITIANETIIPRITAFAEQMNKEYSHIIKEAKAMNS